MELGLAGKRALVTGASRGIGYAIAEALAAEGVRVALAARTGADVEAAATRLREGGAEAVALTGDLTVAADVERVVREAAVAFGGLDILVNNVGGGMGGNTDEAWQYTFDINLNAAVRASRAAVSLMQAQGNGVILIVSSVSGWQVGGSPRCTAQRRHPRQRCLARLDHVRRRRLGAAQGARPRRHRRLHRQRHAPRPLRHAGGDRQRLRLPLLRPRQPRHRRQHRRRRLPTQTFDIRRYRAQRTQRTQRGKK